MQIGDDFMAPDFKLFDDRWVGKPDLSIDFKVDYGTQEYKRLFNLIKELDNRNIPYVWEIYEGDNNMIEEKINNKVLKLYYDRRKEEIIDKYDKKEQEYFNDNKIVKEYNELINKFEEDMNKLYKTVENFDNDYIIESYESNLYKYKINTDKIGKEFEEKEIENRNKEIKELEDLCDEVAAQLSLSDDLDYQLDILNRYGILDKKTKKMVD